MKPAQYYQLAHKSAAPRMDAAFLASQNPAAVKRSVLTNFKDVLLLPVTVVPRTAGYIGSAVARTAGTGLAQLNPRSWQAGSATARVESPTPEKDGVRTPGSTDRRGEINEKDRGYIDFSNGAPGKRIGLGLDGAAFDAEDEDDMHEHNEWSTDVSSSTRSASTVDGSNGGRPTSMSTRPSTVSGRDTPVSGQTSGRNTPQPRTTSSQRLPGTANASPSGGPSQFARLQLLLSLDTALQLVHVDRDCLKRIETFSKYPGNYGHRVRDEIEEVAVAFLQCLGERHVAPGFAR